MPTLQVQSTFQLGGLTFGEQKSIDAASLIVRESTPGKASAQPAAKAGTLTARTDANTGEFTLAAHGFLATQRVDAYWDIGGVKGHRRGMTVGVIAGNVVPIDGGAGDDLPADESPIILARSYEYDFRVDGNDLVGLVFYGDARSIFVLAIADGTEQYAIHFPDLAQAKAWWAASGDVNPVAGDVIAKLFMSHADTAAAKALRVGAAYN